MLYAIAMGQIMIMERATPIGRKNDAVSLQLQRRHADRGTAGGGGSERIIGVIPAIVFSTYTD